jgi:hypothetical protein
MHAVTSSKLLLVLLCLALVAAACQDGGTEATDPPATNVSTTTLAPALPLQFSVARQGFFPDPLPGSAEAAGSGCVIGQDVVPDGAWFGFVDAFNGTTFAIDIACIWTGDAAATAADADGNEFVGFYTRNVNPKVRSVLTSSDATAYWLDAAGDLTPQALPIAHWPSTTGTPYQDCPSDQCAVWIYVNDGVATELVEQYLP